MAFLGTTRPSLWRPNKGILHAALLAAALLAPSGVLASPVTDELKDAQLRGSATFRYLGLPIYDAKLYTPGGAPFSWSEDIGLQLTYRKNFKKKALVNSTLDEMERIGRSAPVRNQLDQCFKAVTKGDSFLAVSDGPNKVSFWLNGQKTCTMSYPGIKRSFMSVFLGDNTRSASFTQKLQGR
ncbi:MULTISPECIES: hypothetical protein [unclassified Ruegeria]|uniref:hypothetical protein n=1 Tax=unclassified Ruegeria TaxID=2625375 RepID=UPI001487B6AF|nr:MULTISPECIES: hypothetical protein [unclassified Ruegeria]NOD76211.1 hypothetical protein [Ruegeria sp. HKCCD4332]NOD90168.1 hypothetical protein [Ruegeria sp. HKCCD4318]NOE15241.1 hypothetical protein [Ruegeria sp. HKCCD4318-2]NOG10549.1 hypothetical protein [Ruegeria sp. HKCCD4315]